MMLFIRVAVAAKASLGLELSKMVVPPLTGRKILIEAEKNRFKPSTKGFSEFVRQYIIEYYGFSNPVEDPFIEEQISAFVSDWPGRVRSLFISKKYYSHLDKLLNGNHPQYLDSEIRFMPRPPSPKPSGSFITLECGVF